MYYMLNWKNGRVRLHREREKREKVQELSPGELQLSTVRSVASCPGIRATFPDFLLLEDDIFTHIGS